MIYNRINAFFVCSFPNKEKYLKRKKGTRGSKIQKPLICESEMQVCVPWNGRFAGRNHNNIFVIWKAFNNTPLSHPWVRIKAGVKISSKTDGDVGTISNIFPYSHKVRPIPTQTLSAKISSVFLHSYRIRITLCF